MSSGENSRRKRAKESASDVGASRKASAGGRKDGKVTAGDFKPLPETATVDERAAYIRVHAGAAARCRRLELGHSWCVGVEIIQVKDLTGLTGKEWDAYCPQTFGFSSRHARDFTALAKAFESIEKMLDAVPEEASFATAVVIARSLIHPESDSEPDVPKREETPEAETELGSEGTASGSGDGGGDYPSDGTPPAAQSKRSRKTVELVDSILIALHRLGDDDVTLLERIHTLLTKKPKAKRESANSKACGKSMGKAKSRRPAGNTKRGQSA